MYPFSFSKHNAALYFTLALAVVCAGVWSIVYAETPRSSGVLTFAVLDIGQGDGLFIEGPTGIQIMVDAGPNNGSAVRELPKVMPLGDRTLDAILETHPDADHMGGFVDVLRRYEVGVFITPGIDKHNATIDALWSAIDDKKIPRIIARRGMVLDLGGGAELDILYPDADVTNFGESTNEGSVVARLVYGKTSALLTADAPFSTEAYLMRISGSAGLKSDILKIGHHGSKYSTGEKFVEEVAPDMAVISVGAKNTYGHPAQRVLDALAGRNIQVLRTDQEGTIICTSDSVQFVCR